MASSLVALLAAALASLAPRETIALHLSRQSPDIPPRQRAKGGRGVLPGESLIAGDAPAVSIDFPWQLTDSELEGPVIEGPPQDEKEDVFALNAKSRRNTFHRALIDSLPLQAASAAKKAVEDEFLARGTAHRSIPHTNRTGVARGRSVTHLGPIVGHCDRGKVAVYHPRGTASPPLLSGDVSSSPPGLPLVLHLHGYGVGPRLYFNTMFPFWVTDREYPAIHVVPHGKRDREQNRYWNLGQGWCCDYFADDPDDVGFLQGVLKAAIQAYSVNTSQVYIVGNSNGAMMAHRLASELSGLVTAVVALSGQVVGHMHLQRPVPSLVVWGTLDGINKADGMRAAEFPLPSAMATFKTWARMNGCASDMSVTSQNLFQGDMTLAAQGTGSVRSATIDEDTGDIIDPLQSKTWAYAGLSGPPTNLAHTGNETTVFSSGCSDLALSALATELWLVNGMTHHYPTWQPSSDGKPFFFLHEVMRWLFQFSRPPDVNSTLLKSESGRYGPNWDLNMCENAAFHHATNDLEPAGRNNDLDTEEEGPWSNNTGAAGLNEVVGK